MVPMEVEVRFYTQLSMVRHPIHPDLYTPMRLPFLHCVTDFPDANRTTTPVQTFVRWNPAHGHARSTKAAHRKHHRCQVSHQTCRAFMELSVIQTSETTRLPRHLGLFPAHGFHEFSREYWSILRGSIWVRSVSSVRPSLFEKVLKRRCPSCVWLHLVPNQ